MERCGGYLELRYVTHLRNATAIGKAPDFGRVGSVRSVSRKAAGARSRRAPGRPEPEAIRLERARTVFGGASADVDLGDPEVADRHFLIEAVGREFFLRDLGGPGGTLVNGRPVRSIELRTGDEVRAGSRALRFRAPTRGAGG